MDFNKPSISNNIRKFLEDNLKTEKEKESLINIIEGKPVLKGDALTLLKSILQAMTISDNLGDDEISTSPHSDEDDGDDGEQGDSQTPKELAGGIPVDIIENEEFPTLAQSMVKWTLVESKNKKENKSPSQNSSFRSPQQHQLTGDELLHKFENTCYFYKLGKCKFGKECKKEHPKFCQKFINFGIIKNNSKGCDSKCNNLHPIACRDSLKSRVCDREKCKFYHLKGKKSQSQMPVLNRRFQRILKLQCYPSLKHILKLLCQWCPSPWAIKLQFNRFFPRINQ